MKTTISSPVCLLMLFAFSIMMGCQSNKNIKAIKLKIYAPTDCIYTFEIKSDSLHIQSVSVSYNVQLKRNDTITITRDTILRKLTQRQIFGYLDSLKNKNFEISKLTETDAYQYELYYSKLVGRAACCTNTAIYILKNTMPYIDRKSIMCSDFLEIVNDL